jgi:small subunit ribosomal protein S21
VGGDFYLQGVARKQGESFENLMRRFNRKIQQSGLLSEAKKRQYREREMSKRELREAAIRKRFRKDAKTKAMLMKGL